ncbi:MAG TPA: hypothetical protein PLD20_23510 [Blastocatellia bacterium]|nr:hypothetical protein [Blastocatellia bacterium]HNG34141.1 hypothetical protein [Blastocatellia bacterium]
MSLLTTAAGYDVPKQDLQINLAGIHVLLNNRTAVSNVQRRN